jgi:hypothetical protein
MAQIMDKMQIMFKITRNVILTGHLASISNSLSLLVLDKIISSRGLEQINDAWGNGVEDLEAKQKICRWFTIINRR